MHPNFVYTWQFQRKCNSDQPAILISNFWRQFSFFFYLNNQHRSECIPLREWMWHHNASLQELQHLNHSSCSHTTDIHQTSQTSYTTLCNGVVSHGAQFGSLRVSADHAPKTDAKPMRPLSSHPICSILCVFYHHTLTWRTACILITRTNLKIPNLSPCRD